LPTELSRVIQLCEKYNVILFSDEIHADIVSCGVKHTPIDSLSDICQTIVATSPSKSFNIAGLGLSLLISRHHDLLQKLTHTFSHLHIQDPSNPFSLVAFEAAYKDGEKWLEEMNRQIDDNEALVKDTIKNNALPLIALKREGTYLLWIDCTPMGLSPHDMRHFFIDQAKVGFSAGLEFGKEGAMFVRLNLASSPDMLLKAFAQINEAWIHQ
jgi:cystathionine beta-lyase